MLFTVNASARFRTPHGSHTVAADGGCVLDACALHAHDVLAYRAAAAAAETAGSGAPRHARLLRVLLESITDLYLLSHGELLVTQGTSHFSTMALALLWARTRAAGAPRRAVLLDAAALASGALQNSWLHGSLNGTAALPPGAGWQRWASHSRRFFEGLHSPLHAPGFDPAAPGATLLGTADGLPLFPGGAFYREAARWLGGAAPGAPPAPVWPGECPLPRAPGESAYAHAVSLVNFGADHSDPHPGQAARCWEAALVLLRRELRRPGAGAGSRAQLVELEDVLTGNLAALRASSNFPYAMDKRKVSEFLAVNVGPQHAAVRGSRAKAFRALPAPAGRPQLP